VKTISKIAEYLAKLQARAWLSHALCSPGQHQKVHETISHACITLPNNSPIKKITDSLSDKPFLIWLLTTAPHLKYHWRSQDF